MADTLTTTTTLATIPSGSVIATDDAGAAGHVQIVKLALSTDGSATPITADANGLEVQGAGVAGTPAGGVVSVQGVASGTALPVSAASLPLPSGAATSALQGGGLPAALGAQGALKVEGVASGTAIPVSAGSLPLPSGAATLAEQQTQTTALQLIDDAVYTDGTGTPSKALGIAGTDGTNPQIVKTDAAGELQVDVLTLPNVTVGAALPAGTNNIGDVDVLTVPADPFGANADAAATAGAAGSMQAKLRLITSQLDSIKTAVETLDNTVGGSELQVDIVSSALPTGAATSALQGGGLPAALGAQGALKVEGVASGTAIPVSVASIPSHAVTNAGTFAVQATNAIADGWDNAASDGASVSGDVAHDGVDAGEPVKIGAVAIAHGTNPTAVAAADRTNVYANRAGVPFMIGGHPNVKTATYLRTDAATDDNVLAAIAGGTKYVITRITITLDEATTVGVAVRLGFGAANVPALGATGADGVEGIIVYHPGMVPGSGIQIGDGSGIIAVGGDGEELRITSEAPTSGTLVVSVSYYTIES